MSVVDGTSSTLIPDVRGIGLTYRVVLTHQVASSIWTSGALQGNPQFRAQYSLGTAIIIGERGSRVRIRLSLLLRVARLAVRESLPIHSRYRSGRSAFRTPCTRNSTAGKSATLTCFPFSLSLSRLSRFILDASPPATANFPRGRQRPPQTRRSYSQSCPLRVRIQIRRYLVLDADKIPNVSVTRHPNSLETVLSSTLNDSRVRMMRFARKRRGK